MNSLSLLFVSMLGIASSPSTPPPTPQPSQREVCEYVVDGDVRVDDFCMKQLAMRTYLDTKPR